MHNLDHSGNAEGFGGKSDVYRQSDFLRQFSSQIKRQDNDHRSGQYQGKVVNRQPVNLIKD